MKYHKLLERQARKLLGDSKSPELEAFLHAVNESYIHYEKSLRLSQRAHDISAEETMHQHNIKFDKILEQREATQKLTEALRNNHNETGNKEFHTTSQSETASGNYTYEENKINKKEDHTKQNNLQDMTRATEDFDQFAYIVSHDLKAPLRAISNIADWIEEDAGESISEAARENIRLLKWRVQRLENLIHGILMYSRAGKSKGDLQAVETFNIVREVVDLINAPDNYEILIKGTWPLIECDPNRLHQVLSNLISNAVKHCDKEKGIITINCKVFEYGCEIAVEDNGPGIEKEYHEKIFQLFQTLSNKDENSNTGIGLSIVKKIVEEQGGKIALESIPGSGSRFSFTWPAEIIGNKNETAVNNGR